MKLRYYYILILLMTVALPAFAQQTDTVIKSNTIEITQSYQPEIKQNPKPMLHPALPPADTSHPTFNYEVPQQTLFYTYNSTPLRPLALGRDTSFRSYRRYVKLGGGNLSTLFFELGEEGKGNNAANPSAEHSLQIQSIAQKGDIKYQQTWLTHGHFDGSFYKDDRLWHGSLDLLRNQYYYYGYNHDLYQYSSGDVAQIYTGIRASIDVTDKDINSIHYNPKITASIYGDTYKSTERTGAILLPVSYDLDTTIQLRASVNGTLTEYKVGLQHMNNNILQLAPGIEYHKDVIYAHAYLNPTIGQNANYLLPDLFASYKLAPELMTISAGIQGLLRQNSFEQITTENPYIYDNYEQRQTKSTEVFGNVSSNIGHHILVSGRISWWQYKDLPVFVNNIEDQKQFTIQYENQLNALSFHATIRYQVNNTFSCGLNGTWYKFNNGNLAQVWHVPTTRIKTDILYHPTNNLNINVYLNLLDGINALDKNGATVLLNGIVDLGGNVEYDIIPRLSAFIQVGNLLNNKNERWLGYTSYGFNIFGGMRLKF